MADFPPGDSSSLAARCSLGRDFCFPAQLWRLSRAVALGRSKQRDDCQHRRRSVWRGLQLAAWRSGSRADPGSRVGYPHRHATMGTTLENGMKAYAGAVYAFLYLPIVVLIVYSFN